jgi:nicotinate-nucleotide adenylyltransferase
MKIGLFFGSFNPVHVGHMVLANYMLEFTDLDRVWFIISPHNPLKDKKTLLAEHHRLQLASIAIGDNTKIKASDIEFKLPQPSYTITTLTYLKEKHPADEFVLIMGEDNLTNFHKWKNYEEILKNYEIYVYPRAKSEACDLQKHPKVKLVAAPIIEISSTEIRKAIKEKKDVRYMLSPAVWEYIKEMHFYER